MSNAVYVLFLHCEVAVVSTVFGKYTSQPLWRVFQCKDITCVWEIFKPVSWKTGRRLVEYFLPFHFCPRLATAKAGIRLHGSLLRTVQSFSCCYLSFLINSSFQLSVQRDMEEKMWKSRKSLRIYHTFKSSVKRVLSTTSLHISTQVLWCYLLQAYALSFILYVSIASIIPWITLKSPWGFKSYPKQYLDFIYFWKEQKWGYGTWVNTHSWPHISKRGWAVIMSCILPFEISLFSLFHLSHPSLWGQEWFWCWLNSNKTHLTPVTSPWDYLFFPHCHLPVYIP